MKELAPTHMSCGCGCSSANPVLINLEKTRELEKISLAAVKRLSNTDLLEPAGTAIVQDGVLGIAFRVSETRVVAVFDDGTDNGITLDATYDESLRRIELARIRTQPAASPIRTSSFDVVTTAAGSFLRAIDGSPNAMLDAEDCAKCILDKCGDCADCALLIPNWPAVLTCLLACAGSCVVKKCWRKCT